MDVDSIPIFAALKKRMNWLNQNQAIISENIANADTPNYSSKVLSRQDFSGLVDTMATGNGGATIGASPATGASGAAGGGSTKMMASVGTDRDAEKTLSGNSVLLEQEMLKLANNQMEYGMVVNLYKKNIGLLKMALGRGANG